MFIFYFLFFWLLNNLISITSFNLKDIRFNFLNEFFFCLDSFSTIFILLYIVLFFFTYDLILQKMFNIFINSKNNFYFLRFKLIFVVLKNLTVSLSIVFLKKTKFLINMSFRYIFNKLNALVFKKRLLM